ncbi:MAG TPA: hypothetical protein VGR20_06055 [Acidimicrobiia bacterium]|nr:hypothetical protein [Acidimicrobiia bacterium]
MVDRVDLLIAVIGIVVSIVGSSTALWMALSGKADKEDVSGLEARLETRLETGLARVETKLEAVEARFGTGLTRVETKLDALILRLVPEQFPHPGE